MSKIKQAAIRAKEEKYTHMSSIIKQKGYPTYHYILPIDVVIENGWIHMSAKAERHITLPENCINKSEAIRRYL